MLFLSLAVDNIIVFSQSIFPVRKAGYTHLKNWDKNQPHSHGFSLHPDKFQFTEAGEDWVQDKTRGNLRIDEPLKKPGSDRTGLTKAGPDRTGLTNSGSDWVEKIRIDKFRIGSKKKKSDRHSLSIGLNPIQFLSTGPIQVLLTPESDSCT